MELIIPMIDFLIESISFEKALGGNMKKKKLLIMVKKFSDTYFTEHFEAFSSGFKTC